MTTVNTLLSGGQGATIPSGIIGEKITWATPPSNQSLTTTITDWTNAFITLSPGTWLVQANICCSYQTGAATTNEGAANIRITDSSNTVVQNMDKQMSAKTVAAVSNNVINNIPFSFVTTVIVSTVYKIRCNKSDSVGTGSGNIFNQVSAASEFFAIRIA